MSTLSDYQKFRGKCKDMVDAAVAKDPTLTAVRGYYHCPMWGKQEHWWAMREDGSILDPTKRQFPSKGAGEYEPFDGNVECAECGKVVPEDEATPNGNYAFCSYICACHFVGVYPS